MFSKACEYAIKALIQIGLSSKQGKRINLQTVAKNIDSPVAFTAKILQALVKENIVTSIKGPAGGYEISKENSETTLLQVVEIIDGEKIYNGCGLGLKKCNPSRPCPMHDRFIQIRTDLKNMLTSTSLDQLTTEYNENLNFLKR
ncbi:MAG: RrF2 family transcriptional regulator [Bacteroidia bacterium]